MTRATGIGDRAFPWLPHPQGCSGRNTHAILAALTACAMLSACSAEKPPVAVTFASICQQEAKTRVAVDGYLRLPPLGITCKSGRCIIAFHSRPGGKGAWIGADVRNTAKPGSGSNAIKMPSKSYRVEDLRVHLKDGHVVGQEEKVRLVGEVRNSGKSCRIEVDAIETP